MRGRDGPNTSWGPTRRFKLRFARTQPQIPMLSTSNVAVQFGAKPLFEQVTVRFADGNRYGVIGATGSGKSTLMKVLGGDLEASAGDVVLQAGLRMGKLNQNQFGYEDEGVLDVGLAGTRRAWPGGA